MHIDKVALIFDDMQRPDTTGVYCLRALRELVATEHFRPSELAAIPRWGFDLYLHIDDSLPYELPPDLRPCAWWAIDTHIDFARSLEKSRRFDIVFAAQRDGAARLRQEGAALAEWLPLACDPAIHRKFDLPKQFDVGFVGRVLPGERAELLSCIRSRYNNVFLGSCHFEAMAQVYSASRVVFNRSLANDINMRVFEGLACGSLLLTNDLSENGQDLFFRDAKHVATYREREEMLDKLDFYLRRDDLRERIAAAGREEVLEKHTYRHRMQAVLRLAETQLGVSVRGPAGKNYRSLNAVNDVLADRSEAVNDPLRQPGAKNPAYFDFARPEVLALIPTTARRILDVGCASGRLGESLKARQDCEVVGIEVDEGAARAARTRLDQVLSGDLETMETDFEDHAFDCIAFADVLEHLKDPARALRQARKWLSTDGTVVASIPNVRHHSVVSGLLEGNWTYEPEGLLDNTHLRFFEGSDIKRLFEEAGYRIQEMRFVVGPGDAERRQAASASLLKIGRLSLVNVTPQEADEFFAYQYLVRAQSYNDSLVPCPVGTDTPCRGPSLRARRASPGLGCILGVQDRPIEVLERTLQTYEYQTVQPDDKVLVDYGSSPENSAAYRAACRRHGWKFVRVDPVDRRWSPAAAYNLAVSMLPAQVEVVFKNDVDVLLGENVLEIAAGRGRTTYCIFAALATAADASYPVHFAWHEDLLELAGTFPTPTPMEAGGFHAYPRDWFVSIGGYDLRYLLWGFDDADLRLRAERSIGITRATDALLIHQWHPRQDDPQVTKRNRAYYEQAKQTSSIIRNAGRLAQLDHPSASPALLTRCCEQLPDVDKDGSTGITTNAKVCSEARRESRAVLAIGPPNPGAGSWEWLGVDLMQELSKYFHVVSWEPGVPECDVLFLVKFPPSSEVFQRVHQDTEVVYCPVDVFGSEADVDAARPLFERCSRVLIHCERLRKYIEPYARVEYMDHHVKYVVEEPRAYQPEGYVLWVGKQATLQLLVDWLNSHPLPCELRVLLMPAPGTRLLNACEYGFHDYHRVSIEAWTPGRHLQLTAGAKAALDIKGNSFRQRHKPATKAIDFIASGVPMAVNSDSSVTEHLARESFHVASPADVDRWLSPEYWQETVRFGRSLREKLSLKTIGTRYRRIIDEVLGERPSRAERKRLDGCFTPF